MTRMTTETVSTATVTLPGNREFTACLYRDSNGEPTDLILSVGWTHDYGWRNRAGVLALPAEALPAIREALAALTDPPPAA